MKLVEVGVLELQLAKTPQIKIEAEAERERDRETERQTETERERERQTETETERQLNLFYLDRCVDRQSSGSRGRETVLALPLTQTRFLEIINN